MSGQAIKWICVPFDELSTRTLYEIVKARIDVFVVEQNCIYQDLDDHDFRAEHMVCSMGDRVVAYSRLLGPDTKFAEPSIGRVLTTQAVRRTNFGRELMRRSIARLQERYPNAPIRIGAQAYLQRFYESFGFRIASSSYLEDGIPHYEMLRTTPAE